MTMRPCVVCGEPTPRSRCDQHRPKPAQPKASPRLKGYDRSWDKLSRKARRMQPWCSDCGSIADLQTDHSEIAWQRKASGKSIRITDVDVVCGDCNRKRGPARGAAVTRGEAPTATVQEPPCQAADTVTHRGGVVISDEILSLTNMVGMRRFKLGDVVTVPDDLCPRCDGHIGETVGRIVGFEGTSKLEDDGHVGPFYVVEVDHPHNGGGRLVYAEAELS